MARVLIIEDNPASLDLMVYLFKAFGHEPSCARDGLEGIEVARREVPDLILCDIQLPGADGIQVCTELKKEGPTKHTPLVAITAYAMVGDRERLLANGFNGYLSKPINPETFIAEMAPYLRTTVDLATQAIAQSHGWPGPTEGTILVVDNSPVNIKLSRSMLEPFGYNIIDAQCVDEAMTMLVEEQSPDLILSDVHMQVKDGFDFIQEVKADDKLSQIPFIFISSTVWGGRERDRGLSLGADQFIIRPIEPQALVAEIEASRSRKKGT